jgi:ABC-type uncharacterized transport system ATPase subunit
MAESNKEAAKAAEERYNQWVKEQEIIEKTKTKIEELRKKDSVKNAYDIIKENP